MTKMLKIKKANEEIVNIKRRENLEATVAKQEAIIDYLAMMCDVEIPVEEGTENV